MEPVRDLGGKNLTETLDYVCDKANLEELKAVLEVIRDKPLKKIKFVTKNLVALARHDINTLRQAVEEEKDVAFTGYVLERISRYIGGRVKKSLESLDMEGMPISKWINLLSLGMTNTLTTLSFRHARIGDQGMKRLFQSRMSSSITSLDLTGCYITSEGMKFLYVLIGDQQEKRFLNPHYHGLEYICLDYNPLGDEGFDLIIDLLMNDFYIKSFELRSCSIKNVGNAIDLVQCNKEIQVLDIRNNNIDEDDADELLKIIIKRHPIHRIKYKWKDAKSIVKYIEV